MPRLHTTITTVQSLGPKDIISKEWLCSYPGYFGFIWEEVDTRDPSLFTVYDWDTFKNHINQSWMFNVTIDH